MHRDITDEYKSMIFDLAIKHNTTTDIVERAHNAFSQVDGAGESELIKAFPNGCTLGEAIQFFISRPKKTREEVEALKADWLRDPCWDLTSAPGFEDYREELKEFEAEMETKWKTEAAARRLINEKRASAYPLLETGTNYDGSYNGDHFSRGGLTKREYFAAAALQGYLASYNHKHEPKPGDAAEAAVKYADALIEALNEEAN